MDFATIRRVWLPLIIASVATGYIFKTAPGPHDWMRWLGLVLALIGIAGVILSRYTLALVTTGIYSKIRNPIYVSGTFFIAGAVLMLRRPEGLLLLMIVIPLQIFRARREAAVLEAKFGDEYREYRRRTWF